jgi:hypothetical protein
VLDKGNNEGGWGWDGWERGLGGYRRGQQGELMLFSFLFFIFVYM